MSTQSRPAFDAVVIGAGFSGIGAAIKLDQAGFRNYVVLEAGDGVGGTWHWNTYPGVAVDIPSFSYQFSFEKRSDWSRVYAPGGELKAYAEDLVQKYGLRDRIRLNSKVEGASFDETANLWKIRTADGETITTRFVVGATGVFSQPKPPEIPGIETFAGPTVHTARWDHSIELRGKRVGVIGTGASAVQLIPAIAPEVSHMTVFQRTPIWCLPKLDLPLSRGARQALRRVPGAKLPTRWVSQAFVELTFVIVAHYAGTFPSLRAKGEDAGNKQLQALWIRWCVRSSRRSTPWAASAPASRTSTSGIQPPERRAGDDRDRGDHTVRDPDHRRCRAPARRPGLRDGLQDLRDRQHPPVRGSRRGRPQPR